MAEYPLDDALLVELRNARPAGGSEQHSPDSPAGVALLAQLIGTRRPTRREWHPRRRTLLLAGLLATAVLAGAAYPVVRELTIGDPAPADVVLAQQIPFPNAPWMKPVLPSLANARVAGVLDSSDGKIYLFASQQSPTRVCGFMWREGAFNSLGQPAGSGSCASPNRSSHMVQGGGGQPTLISGNTGDNVARVTVRVGARTIDLPLSDRLFGTRWFFAELPETPGEIRFYDANDQLIEEQRGKAVLALMEDMMETQHDRLRQQQDHATPPK